MRIAELEGLSAKSILAYGTRMKCAQEQKVEFVPFKGGAGHTRFKPCVILTFECLETDLANTLQTSFKCIRGQHQESSRAV